MIKQLFKVIWNRKRSNMLLVFELFVSCLVIFVVSSLLANFLKNYWAPLGFSYKDVIYLNCYWSKPLGKEKDNAGIKRERYKVIKNELEKIKEVESLSMVSFAVPYLFNACTMQVEYNVHESNAYLFLCDDSFSKVSKLTFIEGRWFRKDDDALKIQPIVINQELKRKLFGKENAVGKIIKDNEENLKIVGVINEYRFFGELSKNLNCYFKRNTIEDTTKYTDGLFMVRLRPNSSIMAEDKMLKKIASLYPDANVTLQRIEDMRESHLKPITARWIFISTISIFLMINAGLGLYGVLWMNINRRKGEIAIRRAVGAENKMIYAQILGEVFILATVSLALGAAVEVQFSVFDFFRLDSFFYSLGILLSVTLIYLITTLCTIYPSYLASKIEPAAALHDE